MAVKTALIGCGNIGSKRVVHIASHPQSTLSLVVGKDPSRTQAFAAQYQCQWSTDWQAAVESGVEAAVVAVPTKYVHEIVVSLLDAGIHVLCEKPLGRDLCEATEITERARRRGLVLETGLNLRYDAGLLKARDLVAQGAIGEPYFLKCDYVNGAVKTNLNEVGSLLDIGIHSIDLMLWFLGGVDMVYGELTAHEGERDDNGFALLRKDRTLASIHFSFVRWRNAFRFEVSGSKGSILVESLPKWGTQTLTVGERVFPSGAPRETRYVFTEDTSWRGEWETFMRHVSGREQGDLDRGLRSMALASLIRESAEHKTPLSVGDTLWEQRAQGRAA